MLPWLGLGVFAALVLSSAGKDKSKNPSPSPPPVGPLPPEVTPGESSPFQQSGGRQRYRPEIARRIVDTLIFKAIVPTDQPSLAMVHPGPGTPLGPNEWGAWHGFKALHEQGLDLWVPTNTHLTMTLPWPVLFVEPSEPVPPDGFALLMARDEQWPPKPGA